MSAERAQALEQIADALRDATRDGNGNAAGEDHPEGALTVSLSDTLARQIERTCRDAAAALREQAPPAAPLPPLTVAVHLPPGATLEPLLQRALALAIAPGAEQHR